MGRVADETIVAILTCRTLPPVRYHRKKEQTMAAKKKGKKKAKKKI